MRRFTALLLSVLLVACTGATGDRAERRGAPTVSVTDSAGVRLVTIDGRPLALPVWRLAATPRYTIDGSTTGDSTALSLVGPVRWLASGGVVAYDLEARRLVHFDSTGRFVGALGRDGSGPGEIRSLVTLQVLPGDSIAGYDGSLQRVSVWHPDVGAVRQRTINDDDPDARFTWRAWLWQDSLLVTLELGLTPPPALSPDRPVARWPTIASVMVRDGAGRVVARTPDFAGPYSAISARGDGRLPFSHLPFVAVGPAMVHFGSGDAFAIGALDPTLRWRSDVRWPAQRDSLTRDEVEAVRNESVELLAQRIPRERAEQAFVEPFLPSLLPALRPAIGRVLVDARDRLWVERFEALRLGSPLQTPASRWTVLSPDGTPIAALELPPRTRLEDVRGDRVVVVQRGVDDVEFVASYQLDTATARSR